MEPKFTVEYSELLCGVLNHGTARLELIESIPVASSSRAVIDHQDVCNSIIDKKTFLTCQEAQKILKILKFRDDILEMIRVLRSVVMELETTQTIDGLIKHVDNSSQEFLNAHLTLKNFKQQSKAVKNLEEKLKKQKEIDIQKAVAIDTELLNSKILRCRQEFDLKTEKDFNIAWVKAQVRQQEIKLSAEETRVNEKLFKITQKSCETDDYYYRTLKFYKEKLNQLNGEIHLMNSLYDSRLEQVETDLQIALNERKRQLLSIETEHDLYKKREEEMKNYQEAKSKKETEKKLRELQEVKVIVIQSWWRGVMVRSFRGKFKTFKKRTRQIKNERNKGRNKKSRQKS